MCHLHREMIIPASKVASINPIIVNAIFDKITHTANQDTISCTRGTISMGGTHQSPLTTETYLPAHTRRSRDQTRVGRSWPTGPHRLLGIDPSWRFFHHTTCGSYAHVQFGSPTRPSAVSMTDIKGSLQVLTVVERIIGGDFFGVLWGYLSMWLRSPTFLFNVYERWGSKGILG